MRTGSRKRARSIEAQARIQEGKASGTAVAVRDLDREVRRRRQEGLRRVRGWVGKGMGAAWRGAAVS